ncbi:PmoA family protein [Singulisphaera sp. Ch08]|uniref:PmoA family protein n=1 Tax=Singulisphaera sp. Ch08 TaxID=3120278 RepID=A0AAU7C795_9BACT
MTASTRYTSLAMLGWALALHSGMPARAADVSPRSIVNRPVVLHANGPIGAGTFLVAEIKGTIPPGLYSLKHGESGKASPAEVFEHAGKSFIALTSDQAEADGTGSYTISGRETTESGLAIAPDRLKAKEVPIKTGGQPFATYISDDPFKPYYFPVIGPTGASYTRAYPMKSVKGEDEDHPHQRSLFFTHGNVNGFDFWAADAKNKPSPKYGSIKETSRTILHNGQLAAVLRTTDDWVGPDGKKVLEDERVVAFYGLGKNRVIDFDVTLKATDGPVTFGDTKEGMFGVRVASSMDLKSKTNSGGKIVNAEGITDDDAWGKASPWVDYSGPLEGKTVGIAILNHPDSFRYPTTWHVRNYGLFAANPFGWHDFKQPRSGEHTLPNGESIRFRYRLILHSGGAAEANLPAEFQAYAKPPRLEIE